MSDDPTPMFVEAIKGRRIRGLLVPTGILLSIAAAAATGVWAGASMVYRRLDERITANALAIVQESASRVDAAQAIEHRMVVLEVTSGNTAKDIAELNRKTDRITDLLIQISRDHH